MSQGDSKNITAPPGQSPLDTVLARLDPEAIAALLAVCAILNVTKTKHHRRVTEALLRAGSVTERLGANTRIFRGQTARAAIDRTERVRRAATILRSVATLTSCAEAEFFQTLLRA